MTISWAAAAAGAMTSIGPCVAPRLAAVLSLTSGTAGKHAALRVSAFVAGLALGYGLIASISGAVDAVVRYSPWTYAALAAVLIVTGTRTLLVTRPACVHAPADRNASPATALLAGLAFSGIGTPCCGPLAAAFAAGSLGGGTVATLAAFFLGHAAPLALLVAGLRRWSAFVTVAVPAPAAATIGGAVTIALGAYYAVLA